MAIPQNLKFEIRGVNHLALVCKDMAKTVDFYTNVLGMPLIKTIDLPNGMGQHFFFDIGNGASIAFFWFPDAPPAAPGVASAGPGYRGKGGGITSAHGSMNHLALDIPPEKVEDYYHKLLSIGVDARAVVNHDDGDVQVSAEMTERTYLRSIYFYDPDGICIELAAWTRDVDPRVDAQLEPLDAEGRRQPLPAL